MGAPTAGALLCTDHDRLDDLLRETKEALRRGEPAGAAERFAAFRAGLERHMAAEEEVVFPEIERTAGTAAHGQLQVMVAEHGELRRRIDEVAAALAADPPPADRTARIAVLTALLAAHNGKEESLVYPLAPGAGAEAASLIERTRARLERGA